MPVYFFHLRGPAGLDRDETGVDFADLDAAYLDAYRTVPTLSAELIRNGSDPFKYAFEIEDGDGTLLLNLPFTETLHAGRRPTRPPSPLSPALTQVQRADSLVALVYEQVEMLRDRLRSSQAWLDRTLDANRH